MVICPLYFHYFAQFDAEIFVVCFLLLFFTLSFKMFSLEEFKSPLFELLNACRKQDLFLIADHFKLIQTESKS